MVEKKGIEPVLLEVTGLVSYADYLLVVTATSQPHAEAVADAAIRAMKAEGLSVLSHEGTASGRWVLADFGDVVLHIFSPQDRGYYDLEGMWMEAKRIPIPGVEPFHEPSIYAPAG